VEQVEDLEEVQMEGGWVEGDLVEGLVAAL
jgi:hypothetical protein